MIGFLLFRSELLFNDDINVFLLGIVNLIWLVVFWLLLRFCSKFKLVFFVNKGVMYCKICKLLMVGVFEVLGFDFVECFVVLFFLKCFIFEVVCGLFVILLNSWVVKCCLWMLFWCVIGELELICG